MTKKEWERARTEEQKEQRIGEIVAATARLYKHLNFEEISFAAIAKEAEFTRSNLYKYFNSKEEIFLEFLKRDIVVWREDLKQGFGAKRNLPVEEFAQIWVDVLLKNNRLLRLFSILNTFLEKNVSIEALVEFKRTVKRELAAVSKFLSDLFPAMTMERASEFLYLQLAAASGLYQMTDLTDTQREVLEYQEFQDMKIDFAPLLRNSIIYIISGLMD